MRFTVATWNVNSLRVRLPLLLKFLEQHRPDIVALQETKVEDNLFPKELIELTGYHTLFKGQKSYNGVALLSKQPLRFIRHHLPHDTENLQCRVLSACLGTLKIINLYAPNGGSLVSEKYLYKLSWYHQLKNYLQETLSTYPYLIVLGDYNIAPTDNDVYDPQKCSNQILTSTAERDALQQLIQLGLYDTLRLHHHGPGHYTWWDYRQSAFARNQGFRIDHILCSQKLSSTCVGCEIDRSMRQAKRPSDHAPILAYFKSIWSKPI